MKIIVARRSGTGEIAYVCAQKISSFHARKNPYDSSMETRIYLTEGKCEIMGDRAKEICDFLASDNDSGILDLTEEKKESVWRKLPLGTGKENDDAEYTRP